MAIRIHVRELHVEAARISSQKSGAFSNRIVYIDKNRANKNNLLIVPTFKVSGFQFPGKHIFVIAVEECSIRKKHLRTIHINPRLFLFDILATDKKTGKAHQQKGYRKLRYTFIPYSRPKANQCIMQKSCHDYNLQIKRGKKSKNTGLKALNSKSTTKNSTYLRFQLIAIDRVFPRFGSITHVRFNSIKIGRGLF